MTQSDAMNRDKRLYLDDLHVGQRFTSGTHVIDEAQIKAPTACPAREGSWTLDDRKSEGLIMCKSAACGSRASSGIGVTNSVSV